MIDGVESATHNLADAARHAPEAVTRQTRGKPLAAGLTAFGAGLLVATCYRRPRLNGAWPTA